MTSIYVVHTEDVDIYHIELTVAFHDLTRAISHIRQEIDNQLNDNEEGYLEWLEENDLDVADEAGRDGEGRRCDPSVATTR